MKKNIAVHLRHFLLLFLLSSPFFVIAKGKDADSAAQAEAAMAAVMDSLTRFDKTIPYQEGKINVDQMFSLNIPKGYKFIPEKEAKIIVTDLWGNPADASVKGMIVPADFKVTDFDSWTFVVSYEETGFVKDEDADDIDYDQMLKDIQAGEPEANKQRVAEGYPSMRMLGWAAKPFYDKDRKILHWAKKFQFGDEPATEGDLTLNYDVRILGRQGVVSLNAVGVMSQLPAINQHIPDVLSIATFNDGYAYKDFNPSVDKVAAYTVGGLIAGKLLAKAGIFVLLLKNIKLVIFALIASIGAFRKRIARIFSRKKQDDYDPGYQVKTLDDASLAALPVIDTTNDTTEQTGPPDVKA